MNPRTAVGCPVKTLLVLAAAYLEYKFVRKLTGAMPGARLRAAKVDGRRLLRPDLYADIPLTSERIWVKVRPNSSSFCFDSKLVPDPQLRQLVLGPSGSVELMICSCSRTPSVWQSQRDILILWRLLFMVGQAHTLPLMRSQALDRGFIHDQDHAEQPAAAAT